MLILITFLGLFVVLFFSLLYQHNKLHIRAAYLAQQCADLRSSLGEAQGQLHVQKAFEQCDPYDYERAYQRSRLASLFRGMPPANGETIANPSL